MRRTIITTLVALAALGGVASADRGGHRDRHDNDRRTHSGWHANGGVRVEGRVQRPVIRYQSQPRYQSSYRYNTGYRYQPRSYARVVRRPIYVQRPVIRYHYYNYYQRPTLLVENYPTRPGYYWVAGQWTWSGYEWIWTPGHYEPDPSYDSQYYDSGYSDGGYYDEYGNWVDTTY